MAFLPELGLSWFNGWLLLLILYGSFSILLLIFPRAVVKRLYARSGWKRRQYVMRAIGLPLSLAAIGLMIFLPLKLGQPVFVVGVFVYIVGLAGFITALINYRNTPLDRPVTQGLYRISRNPQQVTLLLALLGVALAVGSWLVVLLLVIMAFGGHLRILAEERACLAQYGAAYRKYMARVPRYLFFVLSG